jgi:hypothetical protein
LHKFWVFHPPEAKEAVATSDGRKDITGAFDGTWQKSGHVSVNGDVAANTVSTGKVLLIFLLLICSSTSLI